MIKFVSLPKLKKKYSRYFTDNALFNKIKKAFRKAGVSVIYATLLLYYVLKDPNTPSKAKLIIASALGYFILPLDLIPDFIPVTGFTDDLSALILALQQVAHHIKPLHKQQARQKLKNWFKNFSEEDIIFVENKIA
jgi:uncharacterized membrane protein YkvA (DUF1232 family)